MSYNGWKNRETWNVALWLTNDEGLYRISKQILNNKGHKPNNYQEFAEKMCCFRLDGFKGETPDGVSYLHPELDHEALWEMLEELKEE